MRQYNIICFLLVHAKLKDSRRFVPHVLSSGLEGVLSVDYLQSVSYYAGL